MTPIAAIVGDVVSAAVPPGAPTTWAEFCAGKLSRYGLLRELAERQAADLSERWADEQRPERLSPEAVAKLSDEGRADYEHGHADASWAVVQNRTMLLRLEHLWAWAFGVAGDHAVRERIEAKVTVRYPKAVEEWRARQLRHNAWATDGKPQGNPTAKLERPEAHPYADRDCPWCDWYDARDSERQADLDRQKIAAARPA